MPERFLITNANIVNEGIVFRGSVLIEGELISHIFQEEEQIPEDVPVIDIQNNYLIPGVIDDQVHFREPGLTHKGDIYTESRAAVAGGITSFMDMPNTLPPTTTLDLLDEKHKLAAGKSLANYSFYLGATHNNIEEILRVDPSHVCGIKVFMGSSTGNMLVDDDRVLAEIFKKSTVPVAVHSESEPLIRQNSEYYRNLYGEDVPLRFHPLIRSEEACFRSTEKAVALAEKYHTRLHLLHLSTLSEMSLLKAEKTSAEKRITAEVCVHHLWFTEKDYDRLGTLIKWNPSIKSAFDREALIQALKDNKIDVIATDHAPHSLAEKQNPYFRCPSGGPLVQHALPVMLEIAAKEGFTLPQIVEKMCHNVAVCFGIEKRGFIRKGYYADLVAIAMNSPWKVEKHNILYKCGWSPFEGLTLHSKVTHTFVNGHQVYHNGVFDESVRGKALTFRR